MTYKNTYRYIDVLPKFVKGYNDTVHSTTGMAPSKVTDTDILKIWRKMRAKQTSVSRAPAKFKVGQHVRIRKEKLKFAKGGEENYTTEIFQIHTVVSRSPRPVYELVDLLGKHIEGQFYAELSPVIVTKKTVYHIDKIMRKRFRNGISEVFVKWRGYPDEFNSWIPAKAVKTWHREMKKHTFT
jgi:hypothetical protein